MALETPRTVRAEPQPEFVRATSVRVGKEDVPGFFVTSNLFRRIDVAASSTTSWAREAANLRLQVEKLEKALEARKVEIGAVEAERDKYRSAWLDSEKAAVDAAKCGLGSFAAVGWGGLGFLAGAVTCATVSWTLPR